MPTIQEDANFRLQLNREKTRAKEVKEREKQQRALEKQRRKEEEAAKREALREEWEAERRKKNAAKAIRKLQNQVVNELDGQAESESAAQAEGLIWAGKPSYWSYFGIFVAAGICVLAGLGFAMANAAFGLLILGVAPILILWAVLDRQNVDYRLTNEIAQVRRGIVGRRSSVVLCSDIRNITMQYGILDRVVGIGTVEIATAGHAGVEILFRGVKNPDLVADMAQKARRTYI